MAKVRMSSWNSIYRGVEINCEDAARETVYADPDGVLVDYFVNDLRKGVVIYDSEDIEKEAVRLRDSLTEAERDELLESIAKERAEKIVREIIERNFKKIQAEVKAIIDRECQQPQDIRMVDPFA